MQLKRNINEDVSGVSEVVGTILILSITVVLFSTIFATVSYLETPERKTYTEFEASFADVNKILNITHKGGQNLETFRTDIWVVVNDGGSKSHKYSFDDPEVNLRGPINNEWNIGERVTIDLDFGVNQNLPYYLTYGNYNWGGLLAAVDSADIIVMDNGENDVLWRSEISLEADVNRPVIKRTGVDYPEEWEVYVQAGGSVSLYADVEYQGGVVDANLKALVDLRDMVGYENGGAWSTGFYNMSYKGGREFTYPQNGKMTIDEDQTNDTYLLKVYVYDPDFTTVNENETVKNLPNMITGHIWAKPDYITLNVGPQEDLTERPELRVNLNNVMFRPVPIRNREDLIMSNVVIENVGGSSAVVDVYVFDENVEGDVEIVANWTNLNVAAGGGRDMQFTWKTNLSGRHNITVDALNYTSTGGTDPSLFNNRANTTVFVQPTILIVDDDHQDDGDATKMANALQGADWIYDYMIVEGSDGPSWDSGAYQLIDYDVVIWCTGKTKGAASGSTVEKRKTLSSNDIGTLTTYLDSGKSLWLVGEGVGDDLQGTSFVNNELNVDIDVTDSGGANAPRDKIRGVSTPLNASQIFHLNGGAGSYRGDYISIHNPGPTANFTANDTGAPGSPPTVSVSYEDISNKGEKTVFNSFLFNSLEPTSRQLMADRVIRWLGEIESKSGNDLSVANQEFSTRTPMYKDEVLINATIRNNGHDDLPVDVKLKVDGKWTDDLVHIDNIRGEGGTETVTFNWTAKPVGEHDIKVVVDPFNSHDETNENNNDVGYQDINTTVSVRFSILIVDDDNSDLSGDPNTTSYLTTGLDNLDYSYDYFNVNMNGSANGPSYDVLSLYNSIYWVTGNSFDTLTDSDMSNIESYLDITTNTTFYLTGDKILHEADTDPNLETFLDNNFGVGARHSLSFPSNTFGVYGDDLSHGIAYDMLPNYVTSDLHHFDITKGEEVLKTEDDENIACRYHDNGQSSKTVFMGLDISHFNTPIYDAEWYDDFTGSVDTSHEAVQEEVIYLVTKWLGNRDMRTELRVSQVDMEIENHRPMLGRSYLMSATIENIGYQPSNALVRFKDGDSLIASESLYVPANGVSTAEVTWEPLFAGPRRPIRVLVDPLSTVAEIGNDPSIPTDSDHMAFNNHAMFYTQVYYFWDDMENGTDKWSHESTIANINGELPIEYLSDEYPKAYTDIIGDWDTGMSRGVQLTSNQSFSDPNSFWLEEPTAGEQEVIVEDVTVPVDVVLVIDTSGSMDWDDGGNWVGSNDPDSRMYQARTAAKHFVENLTEEDRCAIRSFHPGSYDEDARFMSDGNKTDFYNTLDSMDGDGGTPFYDTLGESIEYLLSDQFTIDSGDPGGDIETDADCSDATRLEFIIGLTDGEDTQSDDYTPDANWGETSGGDDGLLKAPPMIFSIGVVSSALNDGSYPSATEDPSWQHSHDGSPNDEYALWNIADSSSWPWGKYGRDFNQSSDGYDAMSEFDNPDPHIGHYYYAESASDIGNVFVGIRNIIGSISAQAGEAASTGNVTGIGGGGTIMSDVSDTGIKNTGGGSGLMAVAPGPKPMATIVSEGFEGGVIPPGWTIDDTGDSGNEWEIISSSYENGDNANSGTYMAGIEYDDVNFWQDMDEWLISEQIDATSASNLQLSFYDSYEWNNYGQVNYVKVSTTDQQPASFTDTVATYDSGYIDGRTDNDWVQQTIDLSAYDGESSLYIAWEYTGDNAENWYIDDVVVSGDIGNPPSITISRPVGGIGEQWQAGTTEKIWWNTTAGDGTITGVDLEYSTDGGGTWTTIVTGTADDSVYEWTVPNDPSANCYIRATVHDDTPLSGDDESGPFEITEGPPTVLKAYPTIDDTAIPSQYVAVIFDKTMDDSIYPTLTQTAGDAPTGGYLPEGWFTTYETDDTVIFKHDENWTAGDTITLEVTDFTDNNGYTQTTPYSWTFNVLSAGGGSGGVPSGENFNKTAITPTFDLSGYKSAQMTFWHKYKIVPGMNGAFLQVGFKHPSVDGADDWDWKYIVPTKGSYTGNMNMSASPQREDDFNTTMDWAWNGVSGGGSFKWQYVKVNLLNYVPENFRDQVKVKFNYTQYGAGTGHGWYVDDVRIKTSRIGDYSSNIDTLDHGMMDMWRMTNTTDWNGDMTTSWWNGFENTTTGNYEFKRSLDNSLTTVPIDMTNAKTAELSAMFKFNINNKDGAPPDGFRVEVTIDNGVTWMPINLGVRTAKNVSGTGTEDSYAGPNQGNYWTDAGNLSRLNVDLSDFTGYTIQLRFRVITNNVKGAAYYHYDDDSVGFGGFYVDDVIVSGRSIQEG